MAGWLAFGVLGASALGAAVQAVRTTDLVHAVLWLAVALIGTAGMYAVLDAGVLAAIQVLLYTGGVITLMLFSVLLARRDGGAIPTGGSVGPVPAAAVALGTFALVARAVLGADLPDGQGSGLDTASLGALVMGPMVLPFEVLSVLLLAAMIGAIALARRRDP